MVLWALSYLLIPVPASVVYRATSMDTYTVEGLMMLVEAVGCNTPTLYSDRVSLEALLTRHIQIHSAHLTAEHILKIISSTWEYVMYEDTITLMLQLLAKFPDIASYKWPTHAIKDIQTRCPTLAAWMMYFPVLKEFRVHIRKSELHTSLSTKSRDGAGQFFIMALETERQQCVQKILQLVGGKDTITSQCINREFNMVMCELGHLKCLENEACWVVEAGKADDTTFVRTRLTERQNGILEMQESGQTGSSISAPSTTAATATAARRCRFRKSDNDAIPPLTPVVAQSAAAGSETQDDILEMQGRRCRKRKSGKDTIPPLTPTPALPATAGSEKSKTHKPTAHGATASWTVESIMTGEDRQETTAAPRGLKIRARKASNTVYFVHLELLSHGSLRAYFY